MTDQNARPPTDRQCRETRQRVGRQWDEASAAWDLCEPYFATGSWPVTQKLIAGLHLSAGARVLDVGCGVGDPALQIAAAVGPQGTVLAIDLAPGMVAATRRRAQVLGLANITCRVAAAEELTEPAGSFDAVAARFTLMSMPDIPGALRHLRSLLGTGGRMAASVWTHHKTNPMFALPCRELAKVAELPKPGPHEPGAMRLAREGELAGALAEAGFDDIRVEPVPMYQFARDPEDYWRMLTTMAPGFQGQLQHLTDEQRETVRTGLMRAVAKYASGPVIRVPALAQVGTASA